MAGRAGSGSVSEYVAVLRGMGLTEAAIADAHDVAPSEEDLVQRLSERLDGDHAPDYWTALTDAIVASPRGIDVPLSYWNHAPEVHLEELLRPYGCAVEIEPSRRANSLAEGRFVVRLTDASGGEYWTRFEYPESPLTEDNYPALLAHVERELLAGTGLRFVRLQAPPARWRFAMLTQAQLDALRNRYGDRIDVFGAPLLSTHQLEPFVSEDPPVPPAYEPDDGPAADAAGSSVVTAAGGAESIVDRRPGVSFDDLEADQRNEDIVLQFDDEPESPDQLVETVQEADAGSGSTAAASGGEVVEASDDELESVFGDLSEVTLDPEEPDPSSPVRTSDDSVSLGSESDTEAPDDEVDPLDDLFDSIKRDVADSDPTARRSPDSEEPTVSELVDGVAPDEGVAQQTSESADPERNDGTPGDVPRDDADLTASELFENSEEEDD